MFIVVLCFEHTLTVIATLRDVMGVTDSLNSSDSWYSLLITLINLKGQDEIGRCP
jgi:hypothetical protein